MGQMNSKTEQRRRPRSYFIALGWLLICALSWSSFGQSGRKESEASAASPAKVEQGDDEVLRVRTDEVLLPVSVRNGSGTPVNGLRAEDFLVYDNGVRQEIRSFNRLRVPANIV